MTPTDRQRQSAIDTVTERLDVIVALALDRPTYPLDLRMKAADIVAAVIAQIRPVPAQADASDPLLVIAAINRVQRAKARMDRDQERRDA